MASDSSPPLDFNDPALWLLAKPLAIALVTVALTLWGTFSLVEWLAKEPVIKYTVTPPQASEAAVTLENPSIKVPGSSAIHCYAPATGQFLGLVNPSTQAGIDRAIESAQAAQTKWAKTTFSQRRQVLRCLQAFILAHQEDICRVACLDSGKPMVDATLGEILVTVEKLSWTIAHGEKALRPSRRPTNLLMMYKKNTVRYESLGVVAALVSWNYPFHNLIGPMISAIFAGNGIVVKASENTAWSAQYFTAIVKGALQVCGHDPALFQSILCWPQTAGHLTSHPGIAHITFIGSRPVGHKVAASAAKSLTPVCMELGGKDAAIVLDSGKHDLPRITETLLRGTFQSAGQNCVGIERVIACPAVYDQLVRTLETRTKALKVGSALDDDGEISVGAMISAASFDRLEDLIAKAVKDGARLLVGGRRLVHSRYPQGHYFQPTLLVDVTSKMAIAQEECFAPIMVIMRATSTAHAVELANSTEYGLGASVFGKEGHEMNAVVRNIRVGMVAVNDFATYYATQLPFGGLKGSGYGRFAGEEGLRSLCNMKSVCEDRWGWAGVRTGIPPALRYPITDKKKTWEFSRGVVEVGYGMSLWEKIAGVTKLVKNG